MLIAECGVLSHGTARINSAAVNVDNPLSASTHRTIAAKCHLTHSDIPICCRMLVLVYSSDTPV